MRKFFMLCFAAFALFAVTSCGKDSDSGSNNNNEQANSSALVHKAFIGEFSKAAKGDNDTVITYAVSFVDVNHVLVEQVFSLMIDGESELCSIISSLGNYRFDGNAGSFAVVVNGTTHQFQLTYDEGNTLSLMVDGYCLDVTPTDFIAGQEVASAVSNTQWEIDQQAVAAAVERYGEQISGIEFFLSFAGEGASGNLYLSHPMMALISDIDHNIPVSYTSAESTVLHLPYGNVVLDTTSQLGGALVSVHADPVAHYVVLDAHTMIMHLNVGNAAAMLQVPTSDVYLPLRRRTE